MSLSKPCEVKIWTSSHGTDYHYFPSSLFIAFSQNTHPRKNELIQLPLVNALPGRQTTDKFVADFTQDFANISPDARRINIIMMGDNDVRNCDYIGACRVERNVGQLIELHKDSRHGLIVCGLLPSPATWRHTHSLFQRVSNRLYKQVNTANINSHGRKIAFLKTIQIFLDEKGFINGAKFFERDLIHLNSTGALQLACHLIDSTVSIVESFEQ